MASFTKDVIEASNDRLILVDFWAPWCGPCRMLSPILEELAADPKYAGKLEIVKVNTDENGPLAAQYDVSGIPSLKLFKNGNVVQETVGVQPKHALEHLIDGVL